MTQISLPWANNGVGDGQSYDDDEWSDWQRKLWQSDRTVQGVVPGYASELLVSNPAGVTIRVATGAALVDGKFYENDANVDNTVTAPGAGSNFYTVVLQKDWAAQTVRIALLGPDASSPPTVTQTDGTLWEISLATVEIDSGSTITVTDTRRMVGLTLTPPILFRVGGSATDWDQAGTTNYTPITPAIILGVSSQAINAASGSFAIALDRDDDTPFVNDPIVFIESTNNNVYTVASAQSFAGIGILINVSWRSITGGVVNTTLVVKWLLICDQA